VMGQRTYELIADRAVVRPLGTPALKGKSPTPVYELLGLRDYTVGGAPPGTTDVVTLPATAT